jgi:two-component system KDP operon response regulator KdpE
VAKLLLIDDDAALTELLATYLAGQGHRVHVARNGDEGLRRFFEIKPDLVILDIMMPRRDGWQTLERIRELAITPVIMLTSRIEEENLLRGFSMGADDYVTKPFAFAELAARLQTKLMRMGNKAGVPEDAETATALRYGDLEVDLVGKHVWRDRDLIHLTPTEFKILTTLMQREGEILLPEDLVRAAWGDQYVGDIGYVRRYIWHLRKKIEVDPSHPRYIHNEHGFGYRFALTSDEDVDSSI